MVLKIETKSGREFTLKNVVSQQFGNIFYTVKLQDGSTFKVSISDISTIIEKNA